MRFFKIVFAAVFVCYCSGMIFAADSSKSGLLKSLEAAEKYNNKKQMNATKYLSLNSSSRSQPVPTGTSYSVNYIVLTAIFTSKGDKLIN